MRLAAVGGAPPAALAASGGGLRQQLRSAAAGLPGLTRRVQPRQAGRRPLLEVQARDGKKRRKPQQRGSMAGSSSSSDEEAARPAPRRINPDSIIPVRVQQRCVGRNTPAGRVQPALARSPAVCLRARLRPATARALSD